MNESLTYNPEESPSNQGLVKAVQTRSGRKSLGEAKSRARSLSDINNSGREHIAKVVVSAVALLGAAGAIAEVGLRAGDQPAAIQQEQNHKQADTIQETQRQEAAQGVADSPEAVGQQPQPSPLPERQPVPQFEAPIPHK